MSLKLKAIWKFLLILCCAMLLSVWLPASELEWPHEIEVPQAKITIYQPQLETFEGNQLTARTAVSVVTKEITEPLFGAVWIKARVSTDRDARTVRILDIDVTDAKFPDTPEEKVKQLGKILEVEIPRWNPIMSLDRLLTSLELVEKEKEAASQYKTEPPEIIYTKSPAVLVTIDGEPQLRKVEDSKLMRVMNTPYFIVLDPATKAYYFNTGSHWVMAAELKGPWKTAEKTPESVQALAKKLGTVAEKPASTVDRRPQIIIRTRPAELVATDGDPDYTPIPGTSLLYVTNTNKDILLDISSQRHFLLLSGRWYAASTLFGPWSFVASDKLPDSFSKIPEESSKGHLLAFVAGTDLAREALLENQVPQTATIKRNEAKVAVTYEGAPKFEVIEGTTMTYAVNTSYSVIKVGSLYYCCHEGVWFMATDPLGPWMVCTEVPQVIYTMPPSSPMYHVRYVYVYDSTPEVVYVGYTPGYVGCYVYGGTVVYGTGYVYRPYYGRYRCYSHQATWGFAVRYNPYTGNWGCAVGYRSGGWYGGGVVVRGGCWGAGGYHDGDIDIDINHKYKFEGNRNGDFNRQEARNNLYNRREDRAGSIDRSQFGRVGEQGRRDSGQLAGRTPGSGTGRVGQPGSSTRLPSTGTRPSTSFPSIGTKRSNNVYADRNGNVYRHTSSGWEKRSGSSWSGVSSTRSRTTTTTRPSTTTPRTTTPRTTTTSRSRSTTTSRSSSLNRSYQSRQRGTSRTSSYQRSSGYSGAHRSASRSRSVSRGGGRGGRR